jgi:hypothetical protein
MASTPQHYLLAALAAVAVGLFAASLLGVWRRGRAEARAGTAALCSFKWRDYAHLIEDILIERGFKRAGGERRPGDDGFDLLMERGKSKYLVDCKNGSSHQIAEKEVRDLVAVMQMQGAEGAVFATCGKVEPLARRLAASRGVEIIAGEELWRQARPWVPHEVREEVQAKARAERSRLALYSLASALAAGLGTLLLLPLLQRDAADVAVVADTPAEVVLRAPAKTAARNGSALPLPPELSPEEAQARRTSAALEVRSLPAVHNAMWSTRSTLVVTLRPGVELTQELPEEMCTRILQYEELRYIRMQIETAHDGGGGNDDVPGQVRWRQCR